MPVGAFIAAAPSLIKAASGLFGRSKAKKELENLERPEYEIPNSVKEALAIAKAQAGQNMPGLDRMEGNVDLAQANSINSVERAGRAASALAGIQGQTQKAYRDIGTTNASYLDQKQEALKSQLGQYAGYEDRAFQINEFAPFADKYNELQDRLATNEQNIWSGLAEAASIGSTLSGGKSKESSFADSAASAKTANLSWLAYQKIGKRTLRTKPGLHYND